MTNAIQSFAAIHSTNAVDVVSAVVTNPVAQAKEVVSNLLVNGSANGSNAPVASVGAVHIPATNEADAVSAVVTNPVAQANEVVSNLLVNGSANGTNAPVASVGAVHIPATNEADAVSTTVINPAVFEKEAVSNLLENVSVNVDKGPGTSQEMPQGQPEGGFSLTIPVLVISTIVVFFAATRKKSTPGTDAEERKKPSAPPTHPNGTPLSEPRSGETSHSPESGSNIPSVEAGAIADDVLAAVAPDAPDRANLRAALLTAISGGEAPSDPRLSAILRIDESFEKRPGLKYLRRVSVLRHKDGSSGSLAKVESEIGWEYIPDAVRGEFIRTRGDKVARRIYDAGKAKKE